jgi:hypothetical protein
MTTPETSQPPRPAEEVPLVTIVPNLDAFEISGLAEEPPERTHMWNESDIAGEAGKRLSILYLAMGQGVFTLEQIRERTGLDSRQITNTSAQLGNALPEEIFSVTGIGKKRTFTFGDFRIASRMAGEEEVAASVADAKAKAEAAYAQKKEVTDAAEESKINLTKVDHALIRTGGETYYMPVTTIGAVLTVRVCEALKTLHGTSSSAKVRYSDLHKLMWENMTLAERRLFTAREKQLYGNGAPLIKLTDVVVATVMSPLGIASRHRMANHFALGDNSGFTVEIMSEPPEESYDRSIIGTIFPPGTHKSLLHANRFGQASPEEDTALTEVLERILSKPRLTHDDAIDVLDIVTDARAKAYARNILRQRFNVADAEAALAHMDYRSQAALGYGRYKLARGERTIRGSRIKGGIQQVSGDLPGRTFRHINSGRKRDYTEKWHLRKREP